MAKKVVFNKWHLRRLQTLRQWLRDEVKENRFNFDTWAEADVKEVNVCGSTACGLGHAGTIPAFRKRGLRLEFHTTGSLHWRSEKKYGGIVRLRNSEGRSIARGHTAGAKFFGLTDDEARYLFILRGSNDKDMTLSVYIQRLNKFIAKKKRQLAKTD